jgi:hypothetical protein
MAASFRRDRVTAVHPQICNLFAEDNLSERSRTSMPHSTASWPATASCRLSMAARMPVTGCARRTLLGVSAGAGLTLPREAKPPAYSQDRSFADADAENDGEQFYSRRDPILVLLNRSDCLG